MKKALFIPTQTEIATYLFTCSKVTSIELRQQASSNYARSKRMISQFVTNLAIAVMFTVVLFECMLRFCELCSILNLAIVRLAVKYC